MTFGVGSDCSGVFGVIRDGCGLLSICFCLSSPFSFAADANTNSFVLIAVILFVSGRYT